VRADQNVVRAPLIHPESRVESEVDRRQFEESLRQIEEEDALQQIEEDLSLQRDARARSKKPPATAIVGAAYKDTAPTPQIATPSLSARRVEP
jgi:hypothetical protein